MKIKLYIVTYNNAKDLNTTLDTIFKSDIKNYNYEINIINNHSNFHLNKEFKDKVKVLHNVLRPDYSTGFLTRNWNQALILGFKNLRTPDCDFVIACQDDTIFYSNWLKNTIELHKKYSFITYGWGDNFMSWTSEGVKRIGLWDESFQMSGHTSDYFLRALIYNKEKTSINDYHHKRLLNVEKFNIASRPLSPKEHQYERKLNTPFGKRMIEYKWGKIKGCSSMLTHWTLELFNNLDKINPRCSSRILYPYFERDVETLEEQKYV